MAFARIVDTHAHLCDRSFDHDRKEVLNRARKAGIRAVIAVAEDLPDAHKTLELASFHPMIKPAAGLYPTHLDLAEAGQMIEFIRHHREKLVSIGEVGLDFWMVREKDGKTMQKEIFSSFIQLSNELDLPLNVHSRSAGRHAVALLTAHNARRVQLHAFDGKAGTALPGVEAGYLFSIPPSVVRSRQKQKLVKQLPLSCLMVESDSPVLGPDPSARNEPANVEVAIDAIARIKEIAAQEVVEAVSENTARLYGRL